MLKNYDELDKSEQNTKHQADLIEIGMETKLPSRLIYFIVKEENLIIGRRANKKLASHDEKQTLKHRLFLNFIYAKVEVPKDGYHKYRITRFFYWLVSMPIYGTVVLFFILGNTIIVSLERYPMPESEKNAYENVNYLFTSIFTIEVVFKVIGLSPKAFIMDKFNIFDSIIVIVSICELFVSSGSGGVSALRAFRLFRIFKLFRTGNLRVLLDSIAYTMSTIGNYVILLGLFIYVYALLGMQFFAGNLKFDDDGYYDSNGKVPRANFDSLYWAAITVFQVLIGDNWNLVMFDCELAVGRVSALYFISLILFGNIVMLNLFLAILLGNFDKARTYWLKKRIFEMFDIAISREYKLTDAIKMILGDVTDSVINELIVHEPKDIFKLNGRLSIINRKLMMNDPEEEDRVLYYDKVAEYQLEYEPIDQAKRESSDEEDGGHLPLTFKRLGEQIRAKKREESKEESSGSQLKPTKSYMPLSDRKMLEESSSPNVNEHRANNLDSKKLLKFNTKRNSQLSFISGRSNENKHRPPKSKISENSKQFESKLSKRSSSSSSSNHDEENPKICFSKADSEIGIMEGKKDKSMISQFQPDEQAEEIKENRNSKQLDPPSGEEFDPDDEDSE